MDGSKLLLHPLNSSTSLDLYVRNTEWELIDFASKMYEKMYECCPYPFQGNRRPLVQSSKNKALNVMKTSDEPPPKRRADIR